MSLCRSFSAERGPGTFHTLGDLPKRRAHRRTVFHIDLDDDHASSVDEHPAVPFPRCASQPDVRPSSPSSPRPQLLRGASAPILLSNGKPLKSSLKSSSSPAVSEYPHAHHMHLRARSEPSTPVVTPKNVHFPEKDYALATVRVFSRSARPAALSSPPNGNGDETETEGDETPPLRFPFPPLSSLFNYEIDPTTSSPVPAQFSPPANLLLESLTLPPFSPPPGQVVKPLLTGSILVRNIAFEKHVAVRFTLDDWQTVSEVGARYLDSLSLVPSQILSAQADTHPQTARGWDRFVFTIRLEDYAHSLGTRTLWLAARYRIHSTYPGPGSVHVGPGGEWWDNNAGENYRVGFRPALSTPAFPRSRPRRETVSAPISSLRTKPQPALPCKDHASGHMVPSVLKNEDGRSVHESDRRSIPLRAGKLDLCNYASPTGRTAPSASPVDSPERSSPRWTESTSPQSQSDEDTVSPASSTLSSPSVSPTMAPRVIINGHPATYADPHCSGEEEDAVVGSGHIAHWDWAAPGKPRLGGLRYHQDGLVSELPDMPSPWRKALANSSNSLYAALVTQWCFAQGPSPDHDSFDDSGITA